MRFYKNIMPFYGGKYRIRVNLNLYQHPQAAAGRYEILAVWGKCADEAEADVQTATSASDPYLVKIDLKTLLFRWSAGELNVGERQRRGPLSFT